MTAAPRSFGQSYGSLAAAQKGSVGVSYYSRWLNRPWGRVLAAGAHVAGLTPNAVSYLSGLVTLAALILLVAAPPSPLMGVLVGLLLMFGFALDSADGQLARLRGGGSVLGEWLDHLIDSGKMVLVHTFVLLMAWIHADVPTAWLLVPLAYQFVVVVQFSGILLTQFLEPPSSVAARRPSAVRSLALLPGDYGVLCLAFLFSGVHSVFLPLYTALGVCSALLTTAMIYQWARRLARA